MKFNFKNTERLLIFLIFKQFAMHDEEIQFPSYLIVIFRKID